MNAKLSRTFIVLTVLLMFSYLCPYCLSENHRQSYQLLDSLDGSVHYRLNVVISQSLYEYYYEKNHVLSSNGDFANFVTPHALEPIADSLWEIYTDDEDFANGVLMIVHQIPYSEVLPVKYPVETIVENEGDCDLFSYIAASIMMGGGLDVVLLYYESEAHMNIGVHLSHVPDDVRDQAYYVVNNDVRYYVAECTGNDWKNGWRVGECPDDLKHVSAEVITLENCEEWAPGQVSASYETLESSTVSLTISPTYVVQGSTITISGQLSPTLQNETITIYVKVNNYPWRVLGTVKTDSEANFVCVWNPEGAGIHSIRACWSGDNNYAGADSPLRNVVVLSVFFILLLVMITILACVGIVVFVLSRRSQQEVQQPLPPEIPL